MLARAIEDRRKLSTVRTRVVDTWPDRQRQVPRSVARRLLAVAWGLLVMFLLAACQPARMGTRAVPRPQVLRINLQPDIGSLPLLIMQAHRLLERRVPGLTIEWKSISAPDQVHEALASGGLDVATGSPTAFLQARERGVPARVLAAVSELPIEVVVNRPEVRRLRDLRPDDRIAVPRLGGHEHTVLRMAALRELGDWQAVDRLAVVRVDADALSALVSGREITAQVTVPPFLDRARESSTVHRLIGGADVLGGPATMILAYATTAGREQQPSLFAAFLEALRESTDLAGRDRDASAALLAARADLSFSAQALARSLSRPDVTFGTRVRGLSRVSEFLRQSGSLSGSAATWRELAFVDAEGS